ncbi:TCR/Tet family MFS transporter [Cohaesibacter intestini]|uniref:TCR/Tet family MFS transporter n=1 Tax=Cohaesibacter intestini TaxID=2211145 RepID=UPI000DEA8C98|nr:TCR/Tet family MFS transporter [Cohaesibacter intestini]
MTNHATATPAHGHSARFAFITVFLDAMGIGIILPVMPDLIQELSSSSISQAAIYGGYLSFVYALMQFLTGPTLGNFSDRFGRRPILLISLAALGVDYVIMGFAPSLWLLAVGRLIAGIAGATHATAFAVTADISDNSNRTRNFGMVSAGFGFGFIAGPIIGGLVAEFGTRAPFFAAAFLVFLNFLYGAIIFPETLSEENRRAFSWRRANPLGALQQASLVPGLIFFLAAFFLFHLATHIYPAIWPYYTREAFQWTSREIGISLGIFGLFYALVQAFLIRWLLSFISESRVALLGILLETIALIGYLFIFQGWILYLFLPFSALGGITGPAMQGLMTKRVSDNAQGELQGAIASISAITTILSPLIMTWLFAFFTVQGTPYYHPAGAFGIAALLTLLVLWPLRRAISITTQAT